MGINIYIYTYAYYGQRRGKIAEGKKDEEVHTVDGQNLVPLGMWLNRFSIGFHSGWSTISSINSMAMRTWIFPPIRLTLWPSTNWQIERANHGFWGCPCFCEVTFIYLLTFPCPLDIHLCPTIWAHSGPAQTNYWHRSFCRISVHGHLGPVHQTKEPMNHPKTC